MSKTMYSVECEHKHFIAELFFFAVWVLILAYCTQISVMFYVKSNIFDG